MWVLIALDSSQRSFNPSEIIVQVIKLRYYSIKPVGVCTLEKHECVEKSFNAKNTDQLYVLLLIMEDMMNRLFSHISSDESIIWINEIMNIPQTNNQRKMKNKKAVIQLNLRQPYAQHVKETLKLPEV